MRAYRCRCKFSLDINTRIPTTGGKRSLLGLAIYGEDTVSNHEAEKIFARVAGGCSWKLTLVGVGLAQVGGCVCMCMCTWVGGCVWMWVGRGGGLGSWRARDVVWVWGCVCVCVCVCVCAQTNNMFLSNKL